MGQHHDIGFPNESDDYRVARDALLTAEADLRRQLEAVAAQRRALPPGGLLKEDYVFTEAADNAATTETRFSDLFAPGKRSLIVYSFMYAADDDAACPMCTAFLDTFNGNAPHVGDRVNVAVVAKAPIDKIRQFAAGRGWHNFRLLSSAGNSYNQDYRGQNADGGQIPSMNVFQKTEDGIRHFYHSELLFSAPEEGQHMRHMDLLWPLWSTFDLTPDGRGSDWFPKLAYD